VGSPASSPTLEGGPSPPRRRTGLYLAIFGVVVIAAGGFVALSDLGFGFNAVHITAVNLDFTGATCDGWVNSSTSGISAAAGGHVSIPIPLTDGAASGQCVAENVSASPGEFTIESVNTPLTVEAGATESLSIVVGLPASSYTGILTLTVGVESTT
jgi:hypothetical protein